MVSVTSHAKRRLKERCGVSKNSAMDMAERAFNKGISFENASTDLQKYISSVYIRHEKIGDNIRIYGNMVYIFDNRTLITVYPIPGNLLNEMERIATSIDDAADKVYQEYSVSPNTGATSKKVINGFAATALARKLFSGKAHAPYKYSIKNDHTGKFILLSFKSPAMAQEHNDIIEKIKTESGWRVKVNEHYNTALLQTEFLMLLMRNGIDYVKPASFSLTNTVTIYIKEYLPICETLKQEIFDEYGLIVNYAIS